MGKIKKNKYDLRASYKRFAAVALKKYQLQIVDFYMKDKKDSKLSAKRFLQHTHPSSSILPKLYTNHANFGRSLTRRLKLYKNITRAIIDRMSATAAQQ